MSHGGYGDIVLKGRRTRAHRLAWEQEFGPIREGSVIDHICGERSCVNTEHLREVTRAENTQYRVRANRNNTTGYRGVLRHRNGTYFSSVMADGVLYQERGFATAEEANESAIALRAKHHLLGEFSPEL